ncbi:MAG: sigma-70 region 4 domain-containing protein, partial [Gaiellaceae bacterium]
ELREEREPAFGEGFSPELEEGLRALTAGEREVVALRVVLDLDGEEVARLLGITPTAVSTRLHRALAKLEERMRTDDVA